MTNSSFPTLKRMALALALAGLAGGAQAQDALFGTVGSGPGISTLVQINPLTGAVVSTIGDVGFRVNGLTWDPFTRTLYGTTSNNDATFPDGLIIINPTTGVGTPVGAGAGQLVNVVTSNAAGQLFGWTEDSDDAVRWDKAAGTITVLGNSGLSTAEQSLAFNKTTGELFLLNTDGNLYRIDTTTGVPTLVRAIVAPSGIAHHGDFNPDDGNLYAISEIGNDNPRSIYIIDPDTGAILDELTTINNLHTLAFVFGMGPNVLDTLASMGVNVAGLREVFNLHSAALNSGLSNDCSTFDARGSCVAVGGRYSSAGGADATAAFVMGGFRVSNQFRLGLWLDQGASMGNPPGIRLRKDPMFGVYGVWTPGAPGGEGLSVRMAAARGSQDVNITRPVIGTSEPGSGDSSVVGQAVLVEAGFGQRLNPVWLMTPYAGMRYTQLVRKGYSEAAGPGVTAPLTYGRLEQEAVTLVAGARFAGRVSPKTTVMLAAGLEQDIKESTDTYTATGVPGLTPVAFASNARKTRVVLSAGASFALNPLARIVVNLAHRQEANRSGDSTTATVQFQAGF